MRFLDTKRLSFKGVLGGLSALFLFLPPPTHAKKGLYVSLFGGGGFLEGTNIKQSGILYNRIQGAPFANAPFDGDIIVKVKGTFAPRGYGMGGLQIGYLIPNRIKFLIWEDSLQTAAEIESYYLTNYRRGKLTNHDPQPIQAVPGLAPPPLKELDSGRHKFRNFLHHNVTTLIASGIIQLKIPKMKFLSPYIAGGAGVAFIHLYGKSFQIGGSHHTPHELGVNHFNSQPNATRIAPAFQTKIGFQLELLAGWSTFIEYRYLYVGYTHYTFGETKYYPGGSYAPGHVRTSNWKFKMEPMDFHNGVVGIRYTF